MIKVTVNKNECEVHEASGTGVIIMSELCLIVKAVCSGFAQDEDNPKAFCSNMVLAVARALMIAEQKEWGADLEDDENTDF